MKASEHRWFLFRLCLAGFFKRGSCWLLLLALFLFVWVMPLLTPWDEQPQILQPARAQSAWLYVWLALFTWLPFQAAALGRRQRAEGLLEFLRARGTGVGTLFVQMGASVMVWLVGLLLLAGIICSTLCLPRNPDEARQWVTLVIQYMVLAGVGGGPLLLLAVALGTKAGEVVAFLIPVSLLFLGLIAASWLAPMLAGSDALLFRSAWLALPHYHLADLTPRLVFKMGPLTGADFAGSLLCLTLQGAALTLLGRCLFRTRS